MGVVRLPIALFVTQFQWKSLNFLREGREPYIEVTMIISDNCIEIRINVNNIKILKIIKNGITLFPLHKWI